MRDNAYEKRSHFLATNSRQAKRCVQTSRSRQAIYYTFFWVLTATCLKLVRAIVHTESKGDGRNYQLSRATLMKVLRFPLSFSVDCGEQGRVAEHETTDTGGAERRRSKLVQTFPRKDHGGDNFSLTLITRTSYRLGVRMRQSIV